MKTSTVTLTQAFVDTIQAVPDTQQFYDDALKGLFLQVEPDGTKTWFMSCNNWVVKLSPSTILSEVHEKALVALSELHNSSMNLLIQNISMMKFVPVINNTCTSLLINTPVDYLTLKELLAEYNHAGASKYIYTTIKSCFDLTKPVFQITVLWAEKWRNDFIAAGHKVATGNRAVSALRTLLNWGEDRGLCQGSLRKIKMLPETDSNIIIRYLDKTEDDRLRSALNEFDIVFQTIIITELNTGIRLTALLSLQWNDLDFEHQQITLRASTAKNRTNKTVPMNSEVLKALLKLKNSPERCLDCDDYVFINPRTKTRYKNITKLWKKLKNKAQIEDLRFHDLRHNFASQLVMNGVELNTVREVMTHSDLKMTLRYAHLAPDKKMKAVEKLVRHE